MVDGGVIAGPADVLIEIAHFHIKLFAAAIADGQICPVLVEDLSVDGRRVADIEEDLILDGGKKSSCKST